MKCVFWKCFISSNFLTSVVQIIVITPNIFLIILFSEKEYFPQCLFKISTPAFNIFSLLFCFVVENFHLWCGHFLFQQYCRIEMKTTNFHTRGEKFPYHRRKISTPETKYFHDSLESFRPCWAGLCVGRGAKTLVLQSASVAVFSFCSYPIIETKHFHTRE